MMHSRMRGVLNYAASLYFADATLPSAPWLHADAWGPRPRRRAGCFQVRADEPAADRGGAAPDAVRGKRVIRPSKLWTSST